MKVCLKCLQEKPEADFNFRNKASGVRGTRCNVCTRKQCNQSYQNNRKYYRDKQNKLRKETACQYATNTIEYFKTHPCVDCGENDPLVLDFDHLQDKKFNISNKSSWATWDHLLKEIAKCEVRCANCHRRITHKRLNSRKYRLANSLKLIDVVE